MRISAIVASVLVLGSIVFAAGCDAAKPSAADPSASDAAASGTAARQPPAPHAASGVPAPTPPSPGQGRKVEVENDLYEFTYSYPGKAAAIPPLKALLNKRLDVARAELVKGAKAGQIEAKQSGYPYSAHSSGARWQVVTDLPRWLSLSAQLDEYSGGAHGMAFFDALLWDRQQNLARNASDLFISKAAMGAVLREPFCAALDKERAKRRGGPVNRNSGDQFDECIDPVEHTIILGSSNGRTFDRIGILVEPYAAGAYAEGTYEITLPVTERILGSVKPVYKAEFSVR